MDYTKNQMVWKWIVSPQRKKSQGTSHKWKAEVYLKRWWGGKIFFEPGIGEGFQVVAIDTDGKVKVSAFTII